jgi:hypothetical protein
MSDTILTLGDFVFKDMEIPASIPFGGEQRLAVKKLVGGKRVIDALGGDPGPIEWSGVFVGQDAVTRALSVKELSDAGLPLDLTWGQFHYKVVIRSFLPDFQFYEVPYKIVCEVLDDHAGSNSDASPGIDDLIGGDMSAVTGLVSQVGDGTLSNLTSTLQSAVSSVSSFANAAQSTINSVLQPLNAVKQQVTTLISSVDNTLANVSTLGGILPNNPLSTNINKLTSQVNAALNQPALVNLQGVLGRIGTNLTQINSSVQTVTASAGNLYDIAAKQYGDATGWTAIASANNLKDPQLTGNNTLAIPPYTNNSGGVLNV